MRMKYVAAAAALAAALSVTVGCGLFGGGTETTTTTTAPAVERPLIVVGHVPSGNVVDILDRYEPILDYIERSLDVDVDPRFTPDYSNFIEKMESQEYDIAILGPASYIQGHEFGYEAVVRPVRHGSDTYVGMIIARRDSAIREIQDLRGHSFAFVDPESTSGYIFPSALLRNNGIDPESDLDYEFVGGHDNVVLNVLQGAFDAGACFKDARAVFLDDPSDRDELVIIEETRPIANEPTAVSSRFMEEHPDLVQRFIEAMTSLSETGEGREILEGLGDGIGAFVEANDSDYDSVREYLSVGDSDPIEEEEGSTETP